MQPPSSRLAQSDKSTAAARGLDARFGGVAEPWPFWVCISFIFHSLFLACDALFIAKKNSAQGAKTSAQGARTRT
ncbi:hypothetical protein D9M68_813400 [compost metagenome]